MLRYHVLWQCLRNLFGMAGITWVIAHLVFAAGCDESTQVGFGISGDFKVMHQVALHLESPPTL